MGALKLYEEILEKSGVTSRQKQAALYGATAVHAAFGDVELAQITLREGIRQGLDLEQALQDPELVDLVTSPQVLIQLKRFNQSAQQALTARAAKARSALPAATSSRGGGAASSRGVGIFAGGGGAGGARGADGGGGGFLEEDLSGFVGSATSDTAQVDTSVGGVIKRVALLLLALTGLGVGLFFLGLEYMFPKY